MKRRTYLQAMLAAGSGLASAATAAPNAHPIVLCVDLEVDPSREQEMLHNFRTIFRPAAVKHPGYVNVQMLKLRTALQGPAPTGRYRFVLTYESEELRQKWVASDVHKRVWPEVEKTLKSKNYTVLLYDDVTQG